MTAFVESCMKTVTGSAVAVARRTRGSPRAKQLLRKLTDKKNILITTHVYPDPDALASMQALAKLLSAKLPDATISTSFKGDIGGGMNGMFAQLAEIKSEPWDETTLATYDAIILVDTQPSFANCPLPQTITPIAVIDHHRSRARRPKCPFCDLRSDVGATASIVFHYFMELEQPISPDLGATLLFAIESDLAGAAGQPGELDNMALSSLTLIADTRRLYNMRYTELPQDYFVAYANALGSATVYDGALLAHLDTINTPEKPAILADFLLRYNKADFALVTAIHNNTLVMSLRTNGTKMAAADMMRRLTRKLGDGGGHKTKAGGGVPLANGTPTEVDRIRSILRRRYLRALGIKISRGQKLVPKVD